MEIYVIFFLILLLALTVAVIYGQNRNLKRANDENERLRQELQALHAEQKSLLESKQLLMAERAAAQTKLENLEAKAESDKEELEKLQGSFRVEFRNLANDILEEKSRLFKETNKESLEVLLKPFRDNMTQFRERVEKIYSDENQQRGALKNEIQNLMDLNRRITEETNNLTNALKGNSKVQGDWGEMILETILDSFNFRKGVHYTTQENFKDEFGDNLRPDVVLNLPGNKQVVIDSKVSLKSFVDCTSAEDEQCRDAAMKAHLVSVRKHMEELARKSYQNLVNSPDFVIMFVPNEPAFLAALQNDPSIWSDGYNKKIIISSPTNLFALLKIVDDLWRRDNQSKHAIAIAEEGGKLYDKFVGFVDTLGDVGRNIDTLHKNYDKAMSQLSTGRGNLISRTEKLRELGVKASKSLPAQMLENADDAEDE